MGTMRVIEPRQFENRKHTKKPKNQPPGMFFIIIVALVLFTMMYFIWFNDSDSDNSVNQPNSSSELHENEQNEVVAQENEPEVSEPEVQKEPELRIFTDNEFKVFYDQLLLPGLERVSNPPEISGDVLADARIQSIAESRGYKLRSSPVDPADLISVDGFLMQESVAAPWFELKAAAATDGLTMNIVSGYRSVATQRNLYLNRLAATGTTIAQVADGEADNKVNEVLVTSSIPGYSKHHTGYTFDLLCDGFEFENFKNSPCNAWLVADNYKVAKEHGFIPSYPPLADSQGPDPEAWEYVWVGTNLLYE